MPRWLIAYLLVFPNLALCFFGGNSYFCTMLFDNDFLKQLLQRAADSERLRMNYDLRTTPADGSQRMFNAMMPGTEVPVHRHDDTAETVVCLTGRVDEVIYERGNDGQLRETSRMQLCPAEGRYACQIPRGVWHTVEVKEPTVIFEAKDGAFKPRQ